MIIDDHKKQTGDGSKLRSDRGRPYLRPPSKVTHRRNASELSQLSVQEGFREAIPIHTPGQPSHMGGSGTGQEIPPSSNIRRHLAHSTPTTLINQFLSIACRPAQLSRTQRISPYAHRMRPTIRLIRYPLLLRCLHQTMILLKKTSFTPGMYPISILGMKRGIQNI